MCDHTEFHKNLKRGRIEIKFYVYTLKVGSVWILPDGVDTIVRSWLSVNPKAHSVQYKPLFIS